MLAIVPVDGPAGAKGRLAPLLSAAERAELVRAMLEDVLSACRAARSVEGILVVSPAELVLPGVEVLRDPGEGHAAAVTLALRRAPAAGALVLMGDCPLARPETLDRLAAAARPVALCPARDGGTNALALRPPDAVEPAFGVPGGAALTAARAREAGYEPAVIEDERIALDLDTPADARRLLRLADGTATGAFLAERLGSARRLPLEGAAP